MTPTEYQKAALLLSAALTHRQAIEQADHGLVLCGIINGEPRLFYTLADVEAFLDYCHRRNDDERQDSPA